MEGIHTITTPFKVWRAENSDDRSKWLSRWQEWPQREVFAHPSYVDLFAAQSNAQAMCASWMADGVFVLYPFLLRDLSIEPYWVPELGPLTDIVSPYGYGGAFVWGTGDRSAAAEQFWTHFQHWAVDEARVVSEFVRFHLFPDALLEYPGEIEHTSDNIVRDLTLEDEALWMDFKHKVRKNVKKAKRNGLQVEVDETSARLPDFMRIYTSTMDRRDAADRYYFDSTFFEAVARRLSGQFAYFYAIHDGNPVSTELVLVSESTVYSFLGGTESAAFDLRPNDLLKFEIMQWAKSLGKQHFVLGGGYRPDDGIFRYKQAFAPNGQVAFCTGKQVFNQEAYEQLVHNRARQAELNGEEWSPKPSFFPAYRS